MQAETGQKNVPLKILDRRLLTIEIENPRLKSGDSF